MKLVSLSALALLVYASFASAQSCGTPVYRSHPYAVPIVHRRAEKVIIKEVLTPVAVPVLVPATVFQYLPAIVPVAAPVAVVPGQATVVAPGQPQQVAPQQQQADIDRVVRERVDAILREKYGAGDAPPTLILPGEIAAKPAEAPNVQELTQRVAQVLANNCSKCHTTGIKVSGDVVLFKKNGENLEFVPNVSKTQILRAVNPAQPGQAPAMPPTAKANPATALQAADLQLLQQWATKP